MKKLFTEDNIYLLSRLGSLVVIVLLSLSMGFVLISGYKKLYHLRKDRMREDYIDGRKKEIEQNVGGVLEQIKLRRGLAEKRVKAKLQNKVNDVLGIVNAVYERHHGSMPEDELKALLKCVIGSIRFNDGRGRGYAFAIGPDYNVVTHPYASGDVRDYQDGNGLRVVEAFSKLAHGPEGEGFVNYLWGKGPDLDAPKTSPKLAFVKLFKPYDWVVVIGEYLDDMEQDIRDDVVETYRQLTPVDDEGRIFILRLLKRDGSDDQVRVLVDPLRHDLVGEAVSVDELGDDAPYGGKACLARLLGEGEIFVEHWGAAANGSGRPSHRMIYMRYYPDWRWVVGGGFDFAELDKLIEREQAELRREVSEQLFAGFLVFLAFVAIAMLVSLVFCRNIAAIIAAYKERVEERTAKLREEIRVRLEAEDALRRKSVALERSNSELEQFAYVASHDLQEPLRTIYSFAQLLEKRYYEQVDGKGREYLGHITSGALRMNMLIEALLTLARVETRGRTFNATDLGKVFDDAAAKLRKSLEDAGAVVRRTELPTLTVDETQIFQLFQNLITNSVKYNKSKPPELSCEARREGDTWLFCFKDNGIGVGPQYLERVFVVFQRLHTRGEYSGTGIGLALCKKIVQRHGGEIWMRSEGEGKGCEVLFSLPCVPREKEKNGKPTT